MALGRYDPVPSSPLTRSSYFPRVIFCSSNSKNTFQSIITRRWQGCPGFTCVCSPQYLSSSYSHQNYKNNFLSQDFCRDRGRPCWKTTARLWKTWSEWRSWLGKEGRTLSVAGGGKGTFFFRFTRGQNPCCEEPSGNAWHMLRLMGTDTWLVWEAGLALALLVWKQRLDPRLGTGNSSYWSTPGGHPGQGMGGKT